MKNFFDSVISFFDLFIDFVTNIVNGLVDFLTIVVVIPSWIYSFVAPLPAVLMSGVICFVSILVIKTLIGRTGSQ